MIPPTTTQYDEMGVDELFGVDPSDNNPKTTFIPAKQPIITTQHPAAADRSRSPIQRSNNPSGRLTPNELFSQIVRNEREKQID